MNSRRVPYVERAIQKPHISFCRYSTLAQTRIERHIAPVIIMAVERLGDNLPRKIRWVRVFIALVCVLEYVLEWRLLPIWCCTAERGQTGGKSEGAHDEGDATRKMQSEQENKASNAEALWTKRNFNEAIEG